MCENQQTWVFCENPKCDFEEMDFSKQELKNLEKNYCPRCGEATLVTKKVIGGTMI